MEFNRFDLEEQIFKCWAIIDELQDEACGEHENALRIIYSPKFEKLWEMFETMVHEGQI